MKKIFLVAILTLLGSIALLGQTLQDARNLYTEGRYAEALPIFEQQYKAKPNDASINHWYGVSLYMTGGNLEEAEACLKLAAKRKVQEANLFLGAIYTDWFEFDEAEKCFDQYETHLTRKGWRSKAQQEQEAIALSNLKFYRGQMQNLRRMVSHTEDVQIIDSIVVAKEDFLDAYMLSPSGGKVLKMNDAFDIDTYINSTVYVNEKQTKIYFAQPDTAGQFGLYTLEYLLDHFGNEKPISSDNFELLGDINYPFVMPDGVTVYFAAKDEESLGGYDLFVTRYNMNNDTYLRPERLNMPFNSQGNDYMYVVDEEKGVGWFASDRGMDEGYVCVYTFIPNNVVKIIQSEDNRYLSNRARITSIKDTWQEDVSYAQIIERARRQPEVKQKVKKDFEFVINDNLVYYTLHDFKSVKARDAYYAIVKTKAELKDIAQKLEEERVKYMDAPASRKSSMGNGISALEMKQRKLWKEIPTAENEARSLEVLELERSK